MTSRAALPPVTLARRALAPLVLGSLVLASPLLGDRGLASARADVVTTKEGLVLEGAVTREKDGGVTVATATGAVRLAAGEVASVVAGEGPRAAAEKARAALAKDDATGHFRMALSCEAQGLPDLAREEYAAVLALEPDHPAARRALGYEKVGDRWMTVTDARRRKGLVLYQGRWLLAPEVDLLARGKKQVVVKDPPLVQAMMTAATKPALRPAAEARITRANAVDRVEAARALLVHKDPTVRRWACHELEKLGDESALRTLVAVSCRDPHPAVRDAAVRAAATFGNDDLAIPLVRALGSEHLGIVANAGRALGVLGDVRAVGYVIKRIVSHGSSPGAWFADETQQAYIRDFDVEVAQTSFIADPIIGTIQEGAVSDVKVLDATMEWTIVEPILIHTFNRLAHASAKSVDDVKAWVKANGSDLPDFSSKPVEQRAATADALPAPDTSDTSETPPPPAPAAPHLPAPSDPGMSSR